MTIQVTASLTTGTSGSTIITAGSISAAAASTTAGLTNILHMLAPNRNRALRPILKHQFLHEVIPPFCGSLARRE
jgi:hypothetical protein